MKRCLEILRSEDRLSDGSNVIRSSIQMLGAVTQRKHVCQHQVKFLVLSYVYSKQPIFGLTQEWFRELSFSRLESGVHDKLHISSADWWDLLLPLA